MNNSKLAHLNPDHHREGIAMSSASVEESIHAPGEQNPVRFSSPELRQVIDEIGRSTAASERERKNPYATMDLAPTPIGCITRTAGRRWRRLYDPRAIRNPHGPRGSGARHSTHFAFALLVRRRSPAFGQCKRARILDGTDSRRRYFR